MELNLNRLGDQLAAWWGQSLAQLTDQYVLLQVVFIIVIYASAYVLARRTGPILRNHARKIRKSPGMLRIIVALLRRLVWMYFVLLIIAVWSILTNLGWPNTYIVYVALLFSLAWLLITVFAQSIRNRTLRRYIALLAWAYMALLILGIESNVSELLDAIGFSIGSFRLSLLLVIKVLVSLGATLWVAVSLGNFLDSRLQLNQELTPGFRVLIGKILRIALITIAIAIAISAIGIDLTVLSVLSGAIGVGIGFGLQKVVSNFISGLIILADRSIKPGDTISLGDTFGWIRELRARFISVVTRDGREYLIPNEDFITREVINWSFSDDLVRLDVRFGVSYDSNPHTVTELAIAAAMSVPRVNDIQKPVCWMTGFGDSSLDFILRFWISDPQNGLTNIKGQVLITLWDTFAEHGIIIPYPHRELIFKNQPGEPRGDAD